MDEDQLRRHLKGLAIDQLLQVARMHRWRRGPRLTTYSRKVFIPLTQLCADVCAYCTFAKAPSRLEAPYLSPEQVLEIARGGAAMGCKEALFTLGDAPERRYPAARKALAELGFERTIDYVEHCARLVLTETGLIPHINAGILSLEDYRQLRPVAASMGLMLESTSNRLCEKGGPHFGSPDKVPAVRLASLEAAGVAKVPMTSGILIGIGETEDERIDAIFALRKIHRRHAHLQEVIVQNFRAKSDTRMAGAEEPSEDDLYRTIAYARIILDGEVAVQAPPNLNDGRLHDLFAAGIDDWGGISPLTIDHVNPEAPWPEIARLAEVCAQNGRPLVERLTAYPRFVTGEDGWLDAKVRPYVLKLSDGSGLARDSVWSPGTTLAAPGSPRNPLGAPAIGKYKGLDATLDRATAGRELTRGEIVQLFESHDAAAHAIVAAADAMRAEKQGDTVTYVVNRNINYTNICTYSCSFCAFSKTSTKAGTRDKPYVLTPEQVADRATEAWAAGATEVCLQGGIHPSYTGDTYAGILEAVKRAQPGTAAEILSDDVRAKICPDKLSTQEWLDVVRTAHEVGLPTTATIMFGHQDGYDHWAKHLLAIRRLQMETGGFTEFVPLPFVHMEAPMFKRDLARRGPTWRETVLMHAVARLALNSAIESIQCSWVKLGLDGAAAMLAAGCNDLGGVLMNESISRAAGAAHGQEVSVDDLRATADAAGRSLRRRSTLYALLDEDPTAAAPAFV